MKANDFKYSVFVDITTRKICDYYGCTHSKLFSNSRDTKFRLTDARHIAFYLLHHKFSMSYLCIGRFFTRHHTTIMHGIKKIEDQRKIYVDTNTDIDYIVKSIDNQILEDETNINILDFVPKGFSFYPNTAIIKK
jgi:chromosomal replication initiator protein